MKILYLVDYYQPQLGYGEYYVPRELAKKGHQVVILTSNFYYPFPNYAATSGKILGPREQKPGIKKIEGVTVDRRKMRFEIFTRSFFGGHEEYAKKFRPDIVLINKIPGFSSVKMALMKPKYGYKLIAYDAHLPSGFYESGNVWLKQVFYFFYRLFFADLLNRRVDKFIGVQEKTVEIIKNIYGVKKRIYHIPIGTDTQRFRFDGNEGQKIRQKYKIKNNDFVIIYTGKVIGTKGVDILFESFDKLCQKFKNIKLMIVGSGSDDYIQNCLAKLDKKFHDKVVWCGFQITKGLYKFYSAANVGVWPLEESQSMNDAAACGLAFIANHKVGARLRLSNNNALLYKQRNSTDLASKIEFLYLNRTVARQMGKRGRELMEKKLSWSKIVDEYIK